MRSWRLLTDTEVFETLVRFQPFLPQTVTADIRTVLSAARSGVFPTTARRDRRHRRHRRHRRDEDDRCAHAPC